MSISTRLRAYLACSTAILGACLPIKSVAQSYPMVEFTLNIPGVTGNPFDYTQNDVELTLATGDGQSIVLPAFFDGGATWKVRYTPRQSGNVTAISAQLNRKLISGSQITPHSYAVAGTPDAGFIRVSKLFPTQFEFDSGKRYYPVGNDAAWRSGPGQDVTDFFEKMSDSGENWSRVWMCHWDDKNLDWPASGDGEGYLNLTVARRWDTIVAGASRTGIHFQLTLQHHGQYSSMVDPNWADNPWNRKRGGFLDNPEQFFTNDRARKLTRIKYRYIIARYGWSPAIMAWELFNEVEGTDAARNKSYGAIAAWHKEMADFIRAQDPYHHLITTSSDVKIPGLYDAVDYVQPHSYSPDPMATIAALNPADYNKPAFFGEIGPSAGARDDSAFVRTVLWSSLMSANSGAAQYWYWDRMIGQGIFKPFKAFTSFLSSARMLEHRTLKPMSVDVTSAAQGSFSFGPGGGWGNASQTKFSVDGKGAVKGAGAMPSYFQGKAHHDMFPGLEFTVNYAQPGLFSVEIGTIARSGAALKVLIDGKPAGNREFAASDRDTQVNQALSVKVPAGPHTITLQNDGADWVSISRFTLKPYGSAINALARSDDTFAAIWVYAADPSTAVAPIMGTAVINGLNPGNYHLVWWDTTRGQLISTSNVHVGPTGALSIPTPPITESAAAYLTKQ